MVRTNNKPYSREAYKKANPDAPGAWKHDLHQNVKQSLASRISGPSSSSSSSLLSRISGPHGNGNGVGPSRTGKGKELLPQNGSSSKLHGFGATPPINPNNANAGLELLPSANGRKARRGMDSRGRLVDSGLNAALGKNMPRRNQVRPLVSPGGGGMEVDDGFGYANGGEGRSSFAQALGARNGRMEGVSIMGASRGTLWVRVENLAQGTTAEDVVSAFAPAPIINAKISSSASAPLVSVDIELSSRPEADEIISKYNGVVADGNALVVSVVKQGLAERMGRSQPPTPVAQERPSSRPSTQAYAQPGARGELLPQGEGGKMYSDTILASDPRSTIITLAQQEEQARNQRASAWQQTGPSLAQRMGAPGRW